MSRPSPYQRLTVAAKQARQRERMREPAITCPLCETQMGVADIFRHDCNGSRPIHPLEEWLSWSELLAFGVPKATASRWVSEGRIQYQGPLSRRRYRRRNIAIMVLWWKRRYESRKRNRGNGSENGTGNGGG